MKDNNTQPLNAGASWVGGVAPGASDIAVWDDGVTSANSSPLEGNVTWDGIKIANPGGPVTVAGTGILALDGGAGTDIDLTTAMQDLTLSAPLSFSGATEYMRAGGRTVFFDGELTGSKATQFELRSGTNVFTGANGVVTLTTANLYVGRQGANNDATLIVSNGTHEVSGGGADTTCAFIGLGGQSTYDRGHLILEGGALRVKYLRMAVNSKTHSVIDINGGTLESIANCPENFVNSGCAFSMITPSNDGDAANGDNNTATLTVNGGQFLLPNGNFRVGPKGAGYTGTATVNLNGGLVVARRVYFDTGVTDKVFNFNGGTFRFTATAGAAFNGPGLSNDTATFNVLAGGAKLDVPAGALTLGIPLPRFDKLGAGALTVDSAIPGPVRVLGGQLRLTGAAGSSSPALQFVAGTSLSLADGAFATLSPAALTLPADGALVLTLDVGASGSDCLALPSGVVPSAVSFRPVDPVSGAPAFALGDYTVLAYSGAAPDPARFTVAAPAPDRAYSFSLDTAAQTVVLHITPVAAVSIWTSTLSGAWENAGNWSSLPANAPGARVLFDLAMPAPVTATASAPLTLGTLTLSGAKPYTVAAPSISLQSGRAGASAAVSASQTNHTVNAPLAVVSDTVFTQASESTLTLGGAVSGPGRLTKAGGGTLVLTQPNTYAGGTAITGGSLHLGPGATLGAGPVVFSAGGGIRWDGAGPAETFANPFTLSGTMAFNLISRDATLAGPLAFSGSAPTLYKTGAGALTLTGTGTDASGARIRVTSGSVLLGAGADITLESNARDSLIINDDATAPRTVIIGAGARLDINGITTERGTFNDIIVNGGALNLRGGGGSSGRESIMLRLTDNIAGTDSLIVNSGTLTATPGTISSFGVRGGKAALGQLVVHGGVASLARVSLGVRYETGAFDSRAALEIDGGTLEIYESFTWMGSGTAARTNWVNLAGSGVWRTVATENANLAKASWTIMNFDGGTLEALGPATYRTTETSLDDYLRGAKEVNVLARGARIDTRGLAIGIAQPLAGSGAVTKLGPGTLALPGLDAAFTGGIAVEAGALTLRDGASVASLSFADGAAFAFAASPAAGVHADTLALPGALTVTLPAVPAPGTYTLFTYGTRTGGSPADIAVAPSTLGRVYTVSDTGSAITLTVAYPAGEARWAVSGSGAWDVPTNWTPDVPGAAARFDDAISAPATVTLAAPVALDTLAFRNDAPYTLSGAALTVNGRIALDQGTHTLDLAVSSPALTVSGPGTLALTQPATFAPAALVVTNAALITPSAPVWTLPVALGAGGGGFAPVADQTLTLTAPVNGTGPLIKDGSSTLALGANATQSAGTAVRAGTLTADTLPDGPLTLGAATLNLAQNAAFTQPFATLTDPDREATLCAAGTVTLAGPATVSGAFVKSGPGALAFTAPNTVNTLAAYTGLTTSYEPYRPGPNGGPAAVRAMLGFNIADGAVTLGAPGQTNLVGGGIAVGLYTATDGAAETAGALTVTDGATLVDGEVTVGRANGFTGNTATPLSSLLRVEGGLLTTKDLYIGRAGNTNGLFSAPRYEQTGGRVEVTGGILTLGPQRGMTATAEISGGILHFRGGASSLRVGGSGSGGGEATLTLSGSGEIDVDHSVLLGYGIDARGTLNLDGGRLTCQNLYRHASGGTAEVNFNGGTLRLFADGNVFSGAVSPAVKEGGAVIDTSLAGTTTLNLPLPHHPGSAGADGGLTVTGTNTLAVAAAQAYDGPTTVSAGTLAVLANGALPAATHLTVAGGATFAGSRNAAAPVTTALGGLTLADGAAWSATFTATGSDTLAVSGPVALGAAVLRASIPPPNGVWTLITYTGSDPDASRLSVADALPGKAYLFGAANGAVTLTVSGDYAGADPSVSVWKHNAGGAWETAANWSVPPGSAARFDASIAAPATVTLAAPVALDTLYFNSTHAYTLAGSAEFAVQSLLAVESGVHTVDAPVTVSGAGLAVIAEPGAGVVFAQPVGGSGPLTAHSAGDGSTAVTFAAPSTRTGLTTVTAGAIVLKDGGNPGTGPVVIDGGSGLRVTGTAPAVIAGDVTVRTTTGFNAQENHLTLTGDLTLGDGAGITLNKYGTNTLTLAGTGAAAAGSVFNQRDGAVVFADGADYVFAEDTREALRLRSSGVDSPASLIIDPGARIRAGGLAMSAESTTGVCGPDIIVQNGGAVELTQADALFVRSNGKTLGRYVMNGGTLSMPAASWLNVGLYGPGSLEVNGGSLSAGRFASGYQNRGASGTGRGDARVTVTGGRLAVATSWSWTSENAARSTLVEVRGGTLALPATSAYGTSASNWAALLLDGGTLELAGPADDHPDTSAYFGGLNRLAVGAAGGTVQTVGDSGIAQTLEANSPTGTLVKTGGGVLTLASPSNTLARLDVREGTVRAAFTTNALPGVPLFHYRFDQDDPLADASGHGFTLRRIGGTPGTQEGHTGEAAQLTGVSGGGFYQLPDSALWGNVTSFTFACWLYLPANVGSGSDHSLLSARQTTGQALEIKLSTSDGNQVRVLQTSSGGAWWNEIYSVTPGGIPINQWTHIAVTHSRDGVMIYIDGQPVAMRRCTTAQTSYLPYDGSGWYYPTDVRLVPYGTLTGLTIGKTTPAASGAFLRGGLDDFLVYDRILTGGEVAELHAGSPLRRVSVQIADIGIYDLQGRTQAVADASGSGAVIDGELLVTGTLFASPSETLALDDLTLGARAVYRTDIGAATAVAGTLTLAENVTVDLGRTEANPIANSFETVLFTYRTLADAAALNTWTVTGLGRRGYQATLAAQNGEVVLHVKSTSGTLVILK